MKDLSYLFKKTKVVLRTWDGKVKLFKFSKPQNRHAARLKTED